MDRVERQRGIRQHPPLQGEVTIPRSPIGFASEILGKVRVTERLFGLNSPIKQDLAFFQVRLGGEPDPLITAMLDEQLNIRMVTTMESCPVYGDRCAQFIFSNDPEGKIDALDLAPSCLFPELKQSRGIVPNRRTKKVMETLVHFCMEDLR